MEKIDFGSKENLVRIGVLLTFVAITFLMGTAFTEPVRMYFWMLLIILFFETFKLPTVSPSNAAIAQVILSATMVIGGGKGLFSSVGKTFNEYHIFLILFIIGAMITLFGAYKKSCAAGSA